MKIINKGNGVFTVEMENGEKEIPRSAFYMNKEVVELYIPSGVEVINDEAFCFCSKLEKVHMPSSIKKLRNGIFYGNSYRMIEVFYDGTSEQFKKIAKSYQEMITVNIPGPYDGYPYYCTEGSYNKEVLEWRYFDNCCSDCQVVCNDGKRLFYGFSNHKIKN